MRVIALILVGAALAFCGCTYEAPLTTEHKIPIDPEVLGLWEEVPTGDDPSKTPERMLVFRYSATEYLVQYPVGGESSYFRAYPIDVAGKRCVQLEMIGTKNGSPTDRKLFNAATYEKADSTLEIRVLNSDLVSEDLETTAALVAAFRAHRNDKELFNDPAQFKRVGN